MKTIEIIGSVPVKGFKDARIVFERHLNPVDRDVLLGLVRLKDAGNAPAIKQARRDLRYTAATGGSMAYRASIVFRDKEIHRWHLGVNGSGKMFRSDYSFIRLDAASRIRAAIRTERRTRRRPNVEFKTFTWDGATVEYQTTGGVFTSPNTVRDLMNQRSMRTLERPKRPRSAQRHVGIELEFAADCSESALKRAMIDAGLERYVHVGWDSSVSCRGECGAEIEGCCSDPDCWDCGGEVDCDCKGYEIRVCASESEFPQVIRKVCRAIRPFNPIVNSSTGTHVHLDMRHRDPNAAYTSLYHALPLLWKLLPTSRQDSGFCSATQHATLDDQESMGERYSAINVESLSEHNTLEIRMHSGTVNARKIIAWIRTLILIADGGVTKRTATLKGLRRFVHVPPALATTLTERARTLGHNIAA